MAMASHDAPLIEISVLLVFSATNSFSVTFPNALLTFYVIVYIKNSTIW